MICVIAVLQSMDQGPGSHGAKEAMALPTLGPMAPT